MQVHLNPVLANFIVANDAKAKKKQTAILKVFVTLGTYFLPRSIER